MTKLFGAVVGFLSFFKTRPADKAKVIQNSASSIDQHFVTRLYFRIEIVFPCQRLTVFYQTP